MNIDIPKVLCEISGKPLIFWSLELLKDLDIKDVVVVTGFGSEQVEKVTKDLGFSPKFAIQEELKGTAHALEVGLPLVNKDTKTILVLFADDSSLYKKESINMFIKDHISKQNNATFLITIGDEPTDIGGLEIDNKGHVLGVLTLSKLIAKGIENPYLLCGAFCFNKDWIIKNLPLIAPSELSGEYPLPGIIKVANNIRESIDTFLLENLIEWNSVNNNQELKEAKKKKEVLLHDS
jgi:bifunctional N-acetylglucosamine-1-phosphate-uridyltransferase/glucosamine-1-phosphate-acetyltransferase GlmU-like protein